MVTMPRVIVLDNLSPEGLELLEQASGIQFDVKTGLKGHELRETLLDYDGAICRSGVKLTADSLRGNRRLRAIVRAGVGTDNIDKTAATRQGIVVMNTPTGNTLSTAEHTFALLLALSRNVAPAYQSLVEGRWDRKAYMGTQLADKTLGIVGMGRIGQEVARRALAFGMRVIGYDPFLSPERAADLGVEPAASVPEMLPRIDYLTVHTPLNPETKGLIDRAAVESMRPGARLINCARGGIYDEAALVEGLQSGKLAGVALDVYENEPCTDSPLFGMPGVVCTPHLGASTEEAQTQVAVEAVHLLVNFLTTGEIRHAVNVAAVDPKTLAAMRGHLDVAYRLGRLLAQWHTGSLSSCTLHYRGDVAGKDTKLLTSSFCAGLLEEAMEEDVNIVNAEVLLRERGVELIEESSSDKGAFSSSIRAVVTTSEATFEAGGTLFGNEMPRLVVVGDYRLEAYLDGVLMIFSHDDVPGIIGFLGSALGSHQVNIAQMSVGRAGKQPGGKSLGVLNLDNLPSQQAMDEVLGHPKVRSAAVIQLPPAGQLPPWLQV
jgi:D-3-phosphoglycerate dehydrogenase